MKTLQELIDSWKKELERLVDVMQQERDEKFPLSASNTMGRTIELEKCISEAEQLLKQQEEVTEALDACFGVMMQPSLLEDGKFTVTYHYSHFIEARKRAEKLYYDVQTKIKQQEVKVMKVSWNLSSEKLPEIGSNVEHSEDGENVDGTYDYTDKRTCMLAGYAGGYGYFGEGFATDGATGEDKGLICDTPKYWRYKKQEVKQ